MKPFISKEMTFSEINKKTRWSFLTVIAVFLVLSLPQPSHAGVVKEGGHLTGPGDSTTFTVTSPGGELEVFFTYPKGRADFWVRVDDDGRILGDFDLDNGDVIEYIIRVKNRK